MDDDERMEDTEAAPEPQLPLSEDERQVLELYDRLQQIQLEIAIVKAQEAYQSCMMSHFCPSAFTPACCCEISSAC